MSKVFAHLSVHSDYSLAKGTSKVKALVKKAAALNIPALALVDEGNMHGAMQFSEYAAEEGIQPIIGTKLFISIGEKKKGSLTLLAQTEKGFANICAILDHAQRPRPDEDYKGGEGFVTMDIIEQSDLTDVIALSGETDGCLYRLIESGRKEHAVQTLQWFKYYFSDRFYVQIVRFGEQTSKEAEIEYILLEMAANDPLLTCIDGQQLGAVPVVASTEVWYDVQARHDAFEILNAVTNDKTVAVDHAGVRATTHRRYHLRPADVMHDLFADIPHAVENANAIAQRCSYMVKKRKPILPPFQTVGGRTEAEELRAQSFEGLQEKFIKFGIKGADQKRYLDRLEYELGIIERMGFPGYFLIVSDFIKWSKTNLIPVGPGRGSGAGSLVAYALQITNINPFSYGLLFERFLNPDRVSMPDFDIDFCQDRREEVVQYVKEKYGSDYVSMIATFGKILSKTALRDVGRVMLSDDFGKVNFYDIDRLSKLVSMENPTTARSLEYSMNDEDNPEFAATVNSDPKFQVLVKNASQIEGLNRQTGLHAAGVLISGQPLNTLVPVGYDPKSGMSVCQYDMKFAEAAGLVKFDFLGLKTLSVIRETLRTIKETTGEDIDIDLIPMDDPDVYKMLAEGHSNGVFQFESGGMKKALKQIVPTKIEDLVAVGALFRPGPMDMIPLYADCKNGVAKPQYPSPEAATKPFLEETFGILVYQEQVMQIAQVVAGYSLGEADLLRRAMGKKIKEEMDKQRVLFVEGAKRNGHNPKEASELFDTIAKFANYGFNKSHAAAYGVISYQTAYLKKKYPAHFYASLLTYAADADKMVPIKEDMDMEGIPMLLPDINKSQSKFLPERLPNGKFGVRFGLKAIKGVAGDLRELVEAQKAGPFTSLEDFHARAGFSFDKSKKQKLAEAGAFDQLCHNRAAAYEVLAALGSEKKKDPRQTDLFGNELQLAVKIKTEEIPEWANRADREFNAVGFYFGTHPLDTYQPKFAKLGVKRKESLIAYMKEKKIINLPPMGEKPVRMAGLIEFYERKKTKNGDVFLSVRIQERKSTFFVRFFNEKGKPSRMEQWEAILNSAKVGRRPVIIEGRVRLDEGFGDISVFGQEILDAENMVAQERGKLEITLDRDAVRFTPEEQRRLLELTEQAQHRKPEDVKAIENGIKMQAMARKAKQLLNFLESLRKDDDSKAVPIVVALKMEETVTMRPMQGKYLLNSVGETTLKSMDGITSVKEYVE